MLLLTTCLVGAIAGAAENFNFQSETVPYTDMGRGQVAVQLMQIAAHGGDQMHMLVRFDRPVESVQRRLLERSGIHVLSPLGGSAYMASMNPPMVTPNAGVISLIREIRPIEPHWKLHGFLADGSVPTWTMPEPPPGTPAGERVVAVYVMYHSDVALDAAVLDTKKLSGGKIRSTIPSINVAVFELPMASIELLTQDDRVLYIEPALPKFSELNDSNRVITQADTAQSFPYNLDGEGVVVMVYDGGYGLSSHGDFGGRHTIRDNSSLSDHATHVAGTIGGDGSGSGGQYRGMAPAVTIESYGFEQEGGLQEGFLYTDPGDLAQDYAQAINNFGAVLANNSIGTNTASNGFPCEWTGNYGITSNLIDSVVQGDLGGDIRIIWANGNERGSSNCGSSYVSTAPPACAKNHITVGALNSEDDSMTYFSSWGPTDDGRIKPDISAPGCQGNGDGGVTSCSSSGGYNTKCGTSMASPTVTGLSALIMQDWRSLYPSEPDMRSATLKALLAHTAEDKFNVGPDCQYGYGSVRVVDAINQMRSENLAELVVMHGETIEMLVFAEQTSDIKVTIAWDDVPATPLVIPSLVNDIDLTVIDPNGTTHYPWTIDPSNPGNPAVRTQADHVNNIEQVQIDGGVSGVYRVIMTGYNIAQGPQKFSVIASPLLIKCSSAGIAALDRNSYTCGATVGLQVVDCDLNSDDGVIDSVEVTVYATSGDEVTRTLVETGEATAAFSGLIVLGSDLLAEEGDIITLSYLDEDDGQGGSDVTVTDVATIDCTPPMITSVSVIEVLTHEATVQVSTDEGTTLRVLYGSSCDELVDEATSNVISTTHEVRITSLDDNATYYFSVEAYDVGGNTSSDDNGGSCFMFTTADVPDFFTEQFGGNFDLDGLTITFTPYDNVDGYRACAEPITALPTDPNTGNNVPLSDDDYEQYTLQQPVKLYDETYSTVYVCSNGRITFNSGSTDYTEDIGQHFAEPGISMLWDDLNPSSGGTVRFAQLVNRVVVTFDDVPEFYNTGSNTFQCEMYFDGTITISWLGIDSTDNIVGLSRGLGQGDFEASDMSQESDCGDPVVPGDVNGDGFVDITDLLAIVDMWGPCVECPEDLNGDGVVDVVDLLEVVGNWG